MDGLICNGHAPDGIRHHPDLLITSCNINDYLEHLQWAVYGCCFPMPWCGFEPRITAVCYRGWPEDPCELVKKQPFDVVL